ncbi:conserved exported hypothetical protein [Cupriavidus oxalaticus]|jgi:hypothetical protein|uniref:Glycosyl hydrolase n=1 Tax=Cupriavidus oxalaticus TaxID=96344 RepID=A0A375GLQ9_9BURK|nr:glycosyl hydrolase [Cupriavidus oxalaticus]SPC08249.1 conserved exported hypothetical protein [Cupriavidus oxalaticus]SPC20850.1 conserved exported hypothetical protein [Cupriavidus oxalaticus]
MSRIVRFAASNRPALPAAAFVVTARQPGYAIDHAAQGAVRSAVLFLAVRAARDTTLQQT